MEFSVFHFQILKFPNSQIKKVMIIYNATIKPSWEINEAWLEWMTNQHIPDMLATGLFFRHQMVKLLEVDDTDGPTYSIQYYSRSKPDYDQYIREYAPAMRDKEIKLWGNGFVSFRTLMEVIN
jgi:hypothetical protein